MPQYDAGVMKRVYLDFKDWVAMAKAALGKPEEPAHDDALAMARYGVAQGLVEFPISATTYMELLQHSNPKRRDEVGTTIVELSRLRTMAPLDLLLPEEIDRALKARHGRPMAVRSHPIWGRGVGHAFGEPDYEFPLPSGLEGIDETAKARLVARYTEFTERAMLEGPSAVFGVGEVPGVAEARERAERDAAEEAGVGETIRGNFSGGERLRHAWTARAMYELVDPLTRALMRANVHPSEHSAGGKEGMTEFMLDLPTFSTYWELRFLRHREGRSWKGNDMRDLASLVPAIVHCDVVATERNWTALVAKTGRGEKYGTKVIADIRDLPETLAAVA
jgi:hypothetical protein